MIAFPRKDNLVSYWPGYINADDKLYDAIGVNHGTRAGDPQRIRTPFGIGQDYDGTADRFDCGTDDSLDLFDGDLSVFSLVLTRQVGATRVFFDKGNGQNLASGGIGYLLSLASGGSRWTFDVRDGGGGPSAITVTGSTDAQKNRYYFVVGVLDNSEQTGYLYVDGQFDVSNTDDWESVSLAGMTCMIGSAADAGQEFNGNVLHSGVYNAALTPAEVYQLYRFFRRYTGRRI